MTQTQRLTIEEISNKLRPILGSKIDELYFRYSVSESLDEKNEIMHLLAALYQKNLGKFLDKKVLLEPPKKEAVEGEYTIADVSYAGKKLFPFSLKEEDWPRHVCISGMSGSGKTTLAFNILERFIEKDKPFLVFDWKKSFRSLVNKDPSIMNFTVGNDNVSNLFKTNINVPPKGVSPREWINVLCDLLTESFQVSFGVHKILLETLDEIFEGWEIYKKDVEKKHYPNWEHVKKMLEMKAREAHGRESQWYESALRIATVLTFGEFGNVINYDGKKSLSVEDLLDKKVIFELSSLGNIEKKFFAEYILTYMYKLKKANQNKIDKKFNYAILVDEAHNVFLKNKTHFISESVTDMIYRELREYGVSLICLDQHISKLSDTVKGNSACHIAFQQQLPQDIQDISSLMQVYDKKEYFSQLPVGTAIVKLSERHNQPFLVEVPFANSRSNSISDEKLSHKMDCAIQGIEIEKHDPEFKEQIINPSNVIKEYSEENIQSASETPEIPKNTPVSEEKPKNTDKPSKDVRDNLNPAQNILFEFALQKSAEGKTLVEIEKILESGLSEKLYTFEDISGVINSLFNFRSKASKIAFELTKEESPEKEKPVRIDIIQKPKAISKAEPVNQKVVVPQPTIPNESLEGLSNEQKQFISFLIENPNHELSTVELYKQIGISTRKGNIAKNQLLSLGFITVEEQKSLKGWKKLIRISQSYSLPKTNKKHQEITN